LRAYGISSAAPSTELGDRSAVHCANKRDVVIGTAIMNSAPDGHGVRNEVRNSAPDGRYVRNPSERIA
jgi:hypothetical protein